MDLFVGSIGWFGVDSDGLDDVGTVDVVRARCSDGVVGAVESDGVVWGAGPGDVSEGADDGNDLLVGVGCCKNDGVIAWEVAIITSIGSRGIVLGERGRKEKTNEGQENMHVFRCGWMI